MNGLNVWNFELKGAKHVLSGVEGGTKELAVQFRAQYFRCLDHRLHLTEGDVAGQVLHAAIGRKDEILRLYVGQRAFDAGDYRVWRFHRQVGEVEATDYDLLPLEFREHGAVEFGLRRLNRHLLARATG